MAELIRIDKNGTKYFEGYVPCPRCDGKGGSLAWRYTGMTCYKCGGEKRVFMKWVERTPEYQAKLDAKRQAKWDAEQAKIDAERKAIEEAEAKAKAERDADIAKQKEISQYVGNVGDKVQLTVKYDHSAWWEQPSYSGFGTDTMFCHTFVDDQGNVLVWKTGTSFPIDEGTMVQLKGTVKEHTSYKDEKQTVLTRCKVAETA